MFILKILALGLLFLAVCATAFLPILWLINGIERLVWTWTKTRQDQGYQQSLRDELLALKLIEQQHSDLVNQEQRRLYIEVQRTHAEDIQRRHRA